MVNVSQHAIHDQSSTVCIYAYYGRTVQQFESGENLLVSSFHVLRMCFLPIGVSPKPPKSPASNSMNPEAVTPPSVLKYQQ